MNLKKAFTLIELLIVIAIIGVLSTIVVAQSQSAREKTRDARRVSDIKNIQIALEASFQASIGTHQYPADLHQLATEGFMPSDPVGPRGDVYSYKVPSTGPRSTYCLGTTLENVQNVPTGQSISCDSGAVENNYKVMR